MQLMPATAERFGVLDSYDPEANIYGGVRYLRWLLETFHGNADLAVAAYNAGEGNLWKYNGGPPFRETINYINRIAKRLRPRPAEPAKTAEAARRRARAVDGGEGRVKGRRRELRIEAEVEIRRNPRPTDEQRAKVRTAGVLLLNLTGGLVGEGVSGAVCLRTCVTFAGTRPALPGVCAT